MISHWIVCKGTTPEVTTEQPRDPLWDAVRQTSEQLHAVGRLWLRGQVRLGMQLAVVEFARSVAGLENANSAEFDRDTQHAVIDLDREAARLLELQQAYQASAQIMTVAKDLFDTLLRSL